MKIKAGQNHSVVTEVRTELTLILLSVLMTGGGITGQACVPGTWQLFLWAGVYMCRQINADTLRFLHFAVSYS